MKHHKMRVKYNLKYNLKIEQNSDALEVFLKGRSPFYDGGGED